ncbi:MAG: DUF86 domain-containing protein [Thermoplasmatota archaeon]
MVAAGELILRFAKGGQRRFLEDPMVNSAIERQFEVFGEAARRLSPAFRDAHPEVPWRTIIAFRNTLIHGYDAVVPEKVWDVIGKALTPTLEVLRPLLK